jgi:hypothetical protein
MQIEGVLPKWNGARVSHPQRPGLPLSARNFTRFGVVKRAAAETAALRWLSRHDVALRPVQAFFIQVGYG